MKCCRKNLFRNQTDPGICWASASEGHCSKNLNRHSVNQISGLFTSRKEDPTRLVTLHAEISVRAVNDCSKRPAAIFVWFVPSTRNFLAKAVYMVLESS